MLCGLIAPDDGTVRIDGKPLQKAKHRFGHVAQSFGQYEELSVIENLLPTLLTSLTTAVGFASLALSDVIPVKTMGIATATAALLAFVLTILFVPAMLAILNSKVAQNEEEAESHNTFSLRSARFVMRHDRGILLGSLTLFTLIGIAIAWVKVDSNTVRYFKEHLPFQETVTFVQRHLTGPMAYEVVVDSGEEGRHQIPQIHTDGGPLHRCVQSAVPRGAPHRFSRRRRRKVQ